MAEIDYRSCFGAGPQEVEKDDVLLQKRILAAPRVDTLDDLIRELRTAFASDRVDVDKVQDLMLAYKSNPRDWVRFAHFDRHRYTRNLVDEGNGRYNLMLLAWAEGQGSGIHDHSDSHCFMKMLDGSLREIRFAWPSEEGEEMQKTGETLLSTNEVTYINDSIGLHRVENPSHSQTAVSLHLYCPPFDTCQLFDQRTGHKTRGKVTFYSKYSQRTPFTTSGKKMDAADYENN